MFSDSASFLYFNPLQLHRLVPLVVVQCVYCFPIAPFFPPHHSIPYRPHSVLSIASCFIHHFPSHPFGIYISTLSHWHLLGEDFWQKSPVLSSYTFKRRFFFLRVLFVGFL
ncbi:hypothetical protein HGRIS_002613 [Hohenbuehelia grisea]|uniref:Uncharacterized protein n=1 Tax=Hohenbuehelia grisea TaxID=104357 RepID=A0ABR3JLR4_9AGAR